MVFVTKLRHQVFTGTHLTRMEEIRQNVCADFETELTEFNGADNHVHLLVNAPPKVALPKLVNSLKGVTSRRMRQEFRDLATHYYRTSRPWSGSYFAGSAGALRCCRACASTSSSKTARPDHSDAAPPGSERLFPPHYAGQSASPPA
ncbi:hypothetical protein GCM10009733_023280 [Nonomuraea maheshkhaliensis]|uniref:Transposase IS200-like domain-containing protein n=1 Tax=Nonomuraea maheshkhaliensis TaxID=419590 RepID=A0ABP4QYS7_9ACTN